jgi:hypothetical protein
MFCPRCAADNLDDAKYCRACGADIRLVPQALAGLLPAEVVQAGDKPGKKSKKKKDDDDGRLLEKGMENVFVGLAFLLIFLGGLFYMRGAFFLWVWFVIPALACFGEGLGQLLRSRREHRLLLARARSGELGAAGPPALLYAPPRPARTLAAPDTAEMIESPFSVTEATTRHLNSRAGKAPNEY